MSTLSIVEPSIAIRLEGVSKRFVLPNGEPFEAVRNVSLQVRSGDIYGLIGTSGAGKSTLLRLINRLEQPDSGRVFVGGSEITALGKRELRAARQTMGMVFQQFNLLQNATVFDNVAFPLRIHGKWASGEIFRRVRECLHIVGLSDKIDSHPAQLSGGQKQRVAIARALATDPQVLLCDEPTSALDSETTRSVLDTLRDINQRLGVTIVIVTHELAVVRALCRHAAVIERGEVAEELALHDPQLSPRTALGRELAQQVAQADVRDELARLEAAYA
ncbi:methionine ABC transporter ATP-binding protein [Piscinibacter sp. HJYY11]|uniref:methionine ABC transporter ATP-binding protein n=1 Tax=Piscinibacter sp. HJYY11 TaxID=2801333 RepID=UPI00191EB31A|nr:methionine ABC transporter ATP-binding protein [Piscinibacter sp. HJYY11]MBL0728606.1 methionine ABC transporter ATP-binding protein [Piscinibacter sp. HJYY11]